MYVFNHSQATPVSRIIKKFTCTWLHCARLLFIKPNSHSHSCKTNPKEWTGRPLDFWGVKFPLHSKTSFSSCFWVSCMSCKMLYVYESDTRMLCHSLLIKSFSFLCAHWKCDYKGWTFEHDLWNILVANPGSTFRFKQCDVESWSFQCKYTENGFYTVKEEMQLICSRKLKWTKINKQNMHHSSLWRGNRCLFKHFHVEIAFFTDKHIRNRSALLI